MPEPPMKNLAQAWKAWWTARRRRNAMRLFKRLMEDKGSGMEQVVDTYSARKAELYFMGMLDREGFQHCLFCPRRGPLQKHPMGLMCEGHFEVAKRTAIQKEAAVA